LHAATDYSMPGNDLRLLALDGGGVRGLSALMILEQLAHGGCRPRRDCFDMIGGTSTGGCVVRISDAVCEGCADLLG
jgi:patatin-like phospholipase/acyl hydrolase